MRKDFNPASKEGGSVNTPTEMSGVKFCVALNYCFDIEHLTSKDSGRLFDAYVDHSHDDATPGLLSKVIGDPDKTPRSKITRNGGLTNEVFAASLEDQLQDAVVQMAVWDVNTAFDGAIAFTVDDRQVNLIKEQFPHHRGTFKVFDTAKERADFLREIHNKCLAVSQANEGRQMHLDG